MPAPRLKLIEGPAIDGKKEELQGDLQVALGPVGHVVVITRWGSTSNLKTFDSTGRRLWSMDLNRQSEVGTVTALGWRGSELWVSDRRFDQIALIDKGTVTKSLELPTWVRPAWSNRKAFPVFGSMEVLALLANGSMVVVPSRPHSVVATVGYDPAMQYVLRVSENGIIEGPIAKFPNLNYAIRTASTKTQRDRADRFPNAWTFSGDFWPRYRISPDGMRTVVVTVDTSHAAVDTVVVAAVNDQGTPVFTRRFGISRMTYSESQIDSIAARRFLGVDPNSRTSLAKALPRVVPSVSDVTLGRDYSVWISLREADGVKPVIGIDPTGQLLGTLYVPQTFLVRAADGNSLWIVDRRPTFRDVVRYAATKR